MRDLIHVPTRCRRRSRRSAPSSRSRRRSSRTAFPRRTASRSGSRARRPCARPAPCRPRSACSTGTIRDRARAERARAVHARRAQARPARPRRLRRAGRGRRDDGRRHARRGRRGRDPLHGHRRPRRRPPRLSRRRPTSPPTSARSPGSRRCRLVGRQVAARRARHGRAARDARRAGDRLPHRHAAALLRRRRRPARLGPRRRRRARSRASRDAHWRLGGNAILVGRPPTESLDVEPLIEEAVAAAAASGRQRPGA